MPEIVQIIFRGTEDYRRKVKQAALDRKLTVQQFLELSVEQMLDPGREVETQPVKNPKENAAIDLYLRFLEAGPKEDVHIVQSLIARFKRQTAEVKASGDNRKSG